MDATHYAYISDATGRRIATKLFNLDHAPTSHRRTLIETLATTNGECLAKLLPPFDAPITFDLNDLNEFLTAEHLSKKKTGC